MTKLSILATLALLGASSMAFADPVVVRDHRDDNTDYTNDRNFDRNDRGDRGDRNDRIAIDRDHYQPQWISFGTAGTGKTGIAVGSQLGPFQSLRLDASGFMRVRQVVVMFDDGTSQRVKMASGSMSRRSAPLVIDLGGSKRIERIMVYASQFGRGTISVSGLEAKKIFWRRDRGDQLDSYPSNH